MRKVLILVLVAFAGICFAQGQHFSSFSANTALNKFIAVENAARTDYQKKLDNAKGVLLGELEYAMKAATRNANLEEANRLQAAIRDIKEDRLSKWVSAKGRLTFDGIWHISWNNGHKWVYTIEGDSVSNSASKKTLPLIMENGQILCRIDKDTIERFSISSDGRLLVERFFGEAEIRDFAATPKVVGFGQFQK